MNDLLITWKFHFFFVLYRNLSGVQSWNIKSRRIKYYIHFWHSKILILFSAIYILKCKRGRMPLRYSFASLIVIVVDFVFGFMMWFLLVMVHIAWETHSIQNLKFKDDKLCVGLCRNSFWFEFFFSIVFIYCFNLVPCTIYMIYCVPLLTVESWRHSTSLGSSTLHTFAYLCSLIGKYVFFFTEYYYFLFFQYAPSLPKMPTWPTVGRYMVLSKRVIPIYLALDSVFRVPITHSREKN